MKTITPMQRLKDSLNTFENKINFLLDNIINLNRSEPKFRSIYSYEYYEDFYKNLNTDSNMTSGVHADFIRIFKIYIVNDTKLTNPSIGISFYDIDKNIDDVLIKISIKYDGHFEFNFFKFDEFKEILKSFNKEVILKKNMKRDVAIKELFSKIREYFHTDNKKEIEKKKLLREKTSGIKKQITNVNVRIKRKEKKFNSLLEERGKYLTSLHQKYKFRKLEKEYLAIQKKYLEAQKLIEEDLMDFDNSHNYYQDGNELRKEKETLNKLINEKVKIEKQLK